MAEQIVGLRFVTEGYDQANLQIRDYSSALKQNYTQLRSSVNGARVAASTYLRLVAIYESQVAALSKLNRMQLESARAAQKLVNEAAGVSSEYKSAEASAEAFVTELRKQEKAFSDNARAAQEFYREMQTASQANKSAEASAETFTREFQRQEKELEQLAMRYKPLYAASKAYERSLDEISRAQKVGVLSAQQHEAALEQLNKDYADFTNGVARAGNQFARYDVATYRSLQGLKRFGSVGLQQVGYQVGDFAVQVQSGTNALVALGQQGSQLLGIFGAWGAVAGAVLAVGTALGNVVFESLRAAGAGRTLEEVVGDLDAAASGLAARLDLLENTDLVDTYGALTSEVVDLARAMIELDSAAQTKNLLALFDKVEDMARAGFFDRIAAGFTNFGRGWRGEDLIDPFSDAVNDEQMRKLGFQMGSDAFEGYVQAMTSAAKSGDTERVLRVFNDLFDDATDFGAASQDVSLEGYETLRQLYEALTRLAETRARMEQKAADAVAPTAMHLMQIATLQKEVNAGVDDILAGRDAELQKLEDRQRLAQAEIDFGKDSAEYRQTQLEIEERIYRENLAQEGIYGKIADRIVALWRDTVQLEQSVANSAGSAKDLAAGLREAAAAMSSLESIGGRIEKALAVSVAKVDALKRGADAVVAGVIAGYETDIRAQEAALRGAGVDEGFIRAKTDPMRADLAALQASEKERKQLEAAARTTSGGGGGGGGAADDFLSRWPELQAAYTRAAELAQAYGQEVDILDSALAKGLITQPQYNAYVREAQEAYGQASEGAQQFDEAMAQVANTAASQMSQAFMSIVDGSASASDAFRSMAQAILKQAFELAVINPILNSLFGGVDGFDLLPSLFKLADGGVFQNGNATAFARGAAFSGGNVIPFAGGGVVASPTFFPMRNGSTGLMGEAGPEAIMPLKRGSDGKLGVAADGGAAPITVHQTFQFSANGDDSVKRIIAQEAPKIAALTQRQLVEQRRRGGAVKAAFG